MAKYQDTTPLKERESQKQGFREYAKKALPVELLAIGGGLSAMVGYLLGDAALKRKGQEPTTLGEIFSRVSKYPPALRAMVYVGSAAAATAAFFTWRKSKKEELDVEDIYSQYKEARPLRMSNDDIAKENALLKKMVAFEERQIESPKHVQEIVANGPKNHDQHAAHETGEISR